ncbi:hypothetical protein ACRALDRAFT_1092294 [Sodiomyces alcalophilus JCM 7366]|uniref:uncharacterized protein n=1 Tax=Sodiomyces alcalophilus JCM 7366 TaxID=591952 RepID=UPI0039B6AA2D
MFAHINPGVLEGALICEREDEGEEEGREALSDSDLGDVLPSVAIGIHSFEGWDTLYSIIAILRLPGRLYTGPRTDQPPPLLDDFRRYSWRQMVPIFPRQVEQSHLSAGSSRQDRFDTVERPKGIGKEFRPSLVLASEWHPKLWVLENHLFRVLLRLLLVFFQSETLLPRTAAHKPGYHHAARHQIMYKMDARTSTGEGERGNIPNPHGTCSHYQVLLQSMRGAMRLNGELNLRSGRKMDRVTYLS